MTVQTSISTKNIVVLGAGAWGTALALHCHRQNHTVHLWARRKEVADTITAYNENTVYLPNVSTQGIHATSNLKYASQADIVLLAVPSQHIRPVLSQLYLPKHAVIVICCKGIERDSMKLMNTIVQEYFPNNTINILSGPSFAMEVAHNKITTLTLAGSSTNVVYDALNSPTLRLYSTRDVIGAEITGAIKNVIAIASGIGIGLKLGNNAQAGLITRSLFEIQKLNNVLGGQQETLMMPCGIGDLMLTCSSLQSRNMSFGLEIAKKRPIQDILDNTHTITEGYYNTVSIHQLSTHHNIDMPIVNCIYEVLYQNKDIDTALKDLLNTPY